jgi:hypothetical protein
MDGTQGIFKNDSDKVNDHVNEEPLSRLTYAEVVKNKKGKEGYETNNRMVKSQSENWSL